MTPAHEQILNVLLGYLSAMNAEGVLLRAMREAEIQPEQFSLEDLPDILPSIERRARLYVDPTRLGRLRSEISAIGGDRPSRRSKVMVINVEADISEARLSAKAACDARRRKELHVAQGRDHRQRARAKYRPLHLAGRSSSRCSATARSASSSSPWMRVQASRTCREILAGRYKSKTGMGRGIIGVKRLADRFHIDSGPKGTRVEIEVHL